MKIARIVIGALSTSLILLSMLAFAPREHSHTWQASWINHPKNLHEAKELAQAIVVARVESITAGADLVTRAAGEPNGETRIPTQRVTFKILKTLKGTMKSPFTLFRTGTQTIELEGDPAYAAGDTHLLFLTARGDGTYLVISPEGRYHMKGNYLKAASEAPFALALSSKGLSDIEQALKADE